VSDKSKITEVKGTVEVKKPVKVAGKRKQARLVESGKLFVKASFNNMICTVCDDKGNTLAWGSAGASGFKGARKSTAYAATTALENTIRKVMDNNGLREIEIYIKGPGHGREAVLRVVKSIGLRIKKIADVTPIAHNGPRPKKKRRI
jgi:small subunit ribosomal protein S11